MDKFKCIIALICTFLILTNSKDISTLSNYLDIPSNYIYGTFQPDFDKKIVYGDLCYNFQANKNGTEIIFDTSNLNIKNVYLVIDPKKDIYQKIDFSFGEEDENLGTPLIMPVEYKAEDYLIIRIVYETTPEGASAQFLTKEQTYGKKHPCFFTQSEMIMGRSLLPCQDTPAIKVEFDLSIIVPNELVGMISGIFRSEKQYSETEKIFNYEEEIPVPSYLIAMAAGNFVKKNITDNIKVISEPEFVEKAYDELVDDLPIAYDLAVEYMGPYKWKEYNVLVLPRSFPYSGMENPSLSFTSPCLINGDKSLIDIIFHELIHSWSGNLVTNENWSDFWLNEGITMFLQRKIVGMWKNDTEYARMDGYLGRFYISEAIEDFGEEGEEFTKLKPNLTGINPDDIYSDIPYEKGYNFMYYIESLIGEELMEKFFKNYFVQFEYQSIDFYQFKEYFLSFCKNNDVKEETLNKINWTEWIFTSGDIPIELEEENRYKQEVDEIIDKIKKEEFDNDLAEEYKNLIPVSKTYILLSFYHSDKFLTENQHQFFTDALKNNTNFLVATNYYRTILGKTDKFIDNELNSLIDYLSNYGASDYMVGLYGLFYKRDEIKAEETLNSLKTFYHSLMFNMAYEEIENAKNEFPIMKLEINKEKYYYPYDDIFDLNVHEYKESLGELYLDNNIYLKQDTQNDSEIELICSLKCEELQYCAFKKDISLNTFGEFILQVKERIQKMDYAVKASESKKFQIKELLAESQKDKKYKAEINKNSNYIVQIDLNENIDFYFPVYFDNKKESNLKCSISNNIYECEINRTFYHNLCEQCYDFEKHKLNLISKTGKSFIGFEIDIKMIKDDDDSDSDNNSDDDSVSDSDSDSSSDSDGHKGKDDGNDINILAIVLPCAIAFIIIVVVVIYCIFFRKKENDIESKDKDGDKMQLLSSV